MTDKATQKNKLRQYLIANEEGITAFEGYAKLYITKTTTRINEMIRDGEPICKEWINGVDLNGRPVKYMRYYIRREDVKNA